MTFLIQNIFCACVFNKSAVLCRIFNKQNEGGITVTFNGDEQVM